MQVEVDIFSGRPNPRWQLTAQEADEFLRRFQALPQTSSTSPVEGGLGYSGLIVTDVDRSLLGFTEIWVYQGLVIARQDDQSQQLIDHKRRLEQWLFQTGEGQIEAELYQQIGKNL